jgi:DNA repair protein RadD
MKKTLRPYQQAACQAIAKSWARGELPYASIMTGLGKSLIAAALMNRYVNAGERVLCLVPRLELVQQNYSEAFDYMDNKAALGIVCGQLNKRQNHKQAVIAMSTSFVSLRATSGKFDRLIIDECHRLHWRYPDQKPGTIQKIITSLLRINPKMHVCGLTGTHYRLDQGMLHEKSHKALPFFTELVYETAADPGIKTLINDGYLSHIRTLNTPVHADLAGLRVSGEDYNKTEMGVKFDAIIEDAVHDMRSQFERNNIRTAIIFASNLSNARKILLAWGYGDEIRIVCGDESICNKVQRKSAVDWIKNGSGNRYIINVDILAEGFDHRALDCVVLLRATISPGLLVQMVGRVIRPHDDKECGYLIDYGTNLERLTDGGIENVIVPKVKARPGDAPKKLCLECGYPNLLSAKKCKECDAEFIADLNEEGKYTMRTKAQALHEKQDKEQSKITYAVDNVCFSKHTKEDREMIRVEFFTKDYNGIDELICADYIMLDSSGSAGGLAIAKIKRLMKSPRQDWRKIQQFEGGANTKNVLFLLNEYYDTFFRKITGVVTVRSGRFINCVEYIIN